MRKPEWPQALLGKLIAMVTPTLLCKRCVRLTDRVVGKAGDFSLCNRCHASITSKTGVAVRS